MQHEIDSGAHGFIRDKFSHGGFLAERLLSIPPTGKVFAILPADTAHAELIDFESGGVAIGEEVHELADIVQARVSLDANRLCVFEHSTLRLGDPRMPSVDYFTVGEFIFPFVSSRSDHEAIVEAERATHWYPSIGVISSLDSGRHPFPEAGSAQSESLLDNLAEHADAILVGAYDAESWVVWYPTSGSIRAGG